MRPCALNEPVIIGMKWQPVDHRHDVVVDRARRDISMRTCDQSAPSSSARIMAKSAV
jgi:hypothetical protein